ncbi:MAG: cysteine desulfurase NifS [Methanomethylophilus sp.]
MTVKRIVYADNAATTPLRPGALGAMMPYLTGEFGNPSSMYSYAKTAKEALDKARHQIAAALNAPRDRDVYFTSGGSEGDNWVFKGTADVLAKKGKHIITTAIEHHAILNICHWLSEHGYEVTYLPVDKMGRVDPATVEKAIRPDTILISVMLANNEIGTIEPVKEIAKIAHAHGIWMHTDAVQAVGHIPVDVQDLDVDFLTLAGHKFGGPKGIGAVYMKKGTRLTPLIHGGGQERGSRGGTENVAGAVGMGAALTEAVNTMPAEEKRLRVLEKKLRQAILEKIPYCYLWGDPENRMPGTNLFTFSGIEGESIILALDNAGICASSGSACSSASLEPSHVLSAIGLPRETSHGSVRLTLGYQNTEEDVDYIIATLPGIVARLRDMSPIWDDFVKSEETKKTKEVA